MASVVLASCEELVGRGGISPQHVERFISFFSLPVGFCFAPHFPHRPGGLLQFAMMQPTTRCLSVQTMNADWSKRIIESRSSSKKQQQQQQQQQQQSITSGRTSPLGRVQSPPSRLGQMTTSAPAGLVPEQRVARLRLRRYSFTASEVEDLMSRLQVNDNFANAPLIEGFDCKALVMLMTSWPAALQKTIQELLVKFHAEVELANFSVREVQQKHRHVCLRRMEITGEKACRLAEDQHGQLVDLGFRLTSRLQMQQVALIRAVRSIIASDQPENVLAQQHCLRHFDDLKQHYAQQRKQWTNYDRHFYESLRDRTF
ncbi:uncharacterized protein MONBRDRAFT_34666 [Monosiga brevicollis MX1]|uniref:Uncharacterized protein n=1 Tax=Monosiga brevicollis TaxID=81824 RepID=A9VD87_MONBE|nr:uncharacterized protein MONBRDRAFT_34666 [Monosiga brevicollis MX1]EDQ84485.1 predicted protein [Monosiga brevicollis MX1]|eukprot:XP_001750672.1 hypothetical protein [Monosiga brevicollis MX1]